MDLKIGKWVAYAFEGDMLRENNEVLCFDTKHSALEAAHNESCDWNIVYGKNRRVERVDHGVYWYYPKNWDTGEYDKIFVIERLTPENIAEYTDMANFTGDYALLPDEDFEF